MSTTRRTARVKVISCGVAGAMGVLAHRGPPKRPQPPQALPRGRRLTLPHDVVADLRPPPGGRQLSNGGVTLPFNDGTAHRCPRLCGFDTFRR